MSIATTLISATLFALLASPDPGQRTVEQDGNETARASLTGLTKPMLSGFRLRYLNGDHQVRRLGVRAAGNEAVGMLSDQNGGDNMSLRATYLGAVGYAPGTTSGACRGTCTLAVDAPPPEAGGGTWRLVLVGFTFEKTSGDAKVRKMSIQPAADGRSYRVELRDNGMFDYKATVTYAWVRGGASGKTSVTGARAANQRTQAVRMGTVSAAPMLIAGFSVEFTNGDHNLLDLGFERDTDRQYYVRFNDNNYDDPMNATLDLVWMY